ncbi:putative fluoride ion transporter CrcB [Hallella multisaccharivorax DSM 17128]|uniref:Fluoride-specific ion channel FluC n=1 Tax=Hallella multisaccharivorax DSM 17128 TaxID=688246 RepID=F8N733_9BACT|nr:fluoride efflux transporter CrcB [Hallella multisaccharivorax]EGN56331.1 camphor resistance protein CrcB [Hallella multisaccharivorax DSM 17128]GJG29843.1 putative fluoride ion transporter CrcB [Hallella multisaccharivorax DSM 17128]
MLKDFFIVGAGSFLGGGARFVVSKVVQTWTTLPFPLGTFVVNVLGCLLIGFFSGLNHGGDWMSPSTRLILTTGFCGGFTTFSTFISEGTALAGDHNFGWLALYTFGSLVVGFVCVLAGHSVARAL